MKGFQILELLKCLWVAFNYITLYLTILFGNTLLKQFLDGEIVEELVGKIFIFYFSTRYCTPSDLLRDKNCSGDIDKIIFICYFFPKGSSPTIWCPQYNNPRIFPRMTFPKTQSQTFNDIITNLIFVFWWCVYLEIGWVILF
jgi:hypothetical protein